MAKRPARKTSKKVVLPAMPSDEQHQPPPLPPAALPEIPAALLPPPLLPDRPAPPGYEFIGHYARVALVLQGGGALGAYQAGAYEALAEVGIHPDWVAGISIGSINSAIIAGNAPEHRVSRLKDFWERVTTPLEMPSLAKGDDLRGWFNAFSAATSVMRGQAGFFKPRFPNPWLQPRGTIEAISYYDTSPLKSTLEDLVDFDRINARETRLAVGAVNVRSGNFSYFDNHYRKIRPEHIMASGALPPGFPPIEIDGQHYWDGGLVSNTPLTYVLDDLPRLSTLAFQVDLFSAQGELPSEMSQVAERQKDIIYSSRTRANTDIFRRQQRMRAAIRYLLEKIPPEERQNDRVIAELIAPHACSTVFNIVQLIYRQSNYESDTKDYEFSRQSMLDHWRTGYNDTVRTLRHPHWLEPPRSIDGVTVHDVHRDSKD